MVRLGLKLNKTTIYMSVLVVIVIIFSVLYVITKKPAEELNIVVAETETSNETEIVESTPQNIVVHVIGEVLNPGVYTLEEGSRVKDIISKAGGVTEYANVEVVNLAAFLQDAEQIVIPKKQYNTPEYMDATEYETFDTQSPASNITASTSNKPSKININTADMTELMSLDGIGEALAKSIINYRESTGRYNYIEEIKNVERIGEKTYSKIKEYICVN